MYTFEYRRIYPESVYTVGFMVGTFWVTDSDQATEQDAQDRVNFLNSLNAQDRSVVTDHLIDRFYGFK